ncbi:60S ribosomal protein L7-like 1 isoform X2 [Oenanthe melanoleuca]|uniref:60S ribosomal protein L7-like 1 isoform X2 n=1 Tax=Oenanthe melanoleuca TaxID=2939378 RepID=UPI0024C1B2F6|nr:60S ribosomal protein L7-like 1 isoform X2 [Oenanthe melanoleuca]
MGSCVCSPRAVFFLAFGMEFLTTDFHVLGVETQVGSFIRVLQNHRGEQRDPPNLPARLHGGAEGAHQEHTRQHHRTELRLWHHLRVRRCPRARSSPGLPAGGCPGRAHGWLLDKAIPCPPGLPALPGASRRSAIPGKASASPRMRGAARQDGGAGGAEAADPAGAGELAEEEEGVPGHQGHPGQAGAAQQAQAAEGEADPVQAAGDLCSGFVAQAPG